MANQNLLVGDLFHTRFNDLSSPEIKSEQAITFFTTAFEQSF